MVSVLLANRTLLALRHFRDFPRRRKAASFTIDDALEKNARSQNGPTESLLIEIGILEAAVHASVVQLQCRLRALNSNRPPGGDDHLSAPSLDTDSRPLQ